MYQNWLLNASLFFLCGNFIVLGASAFVAWQAALAYAVWMISVTLIGMVVYFGSKFTFNAIRKNKEATR